jgi:hypothetical protein
MPPSARRRPRALALAAASRLAACAPLFLACASPLPEYARPVAEFREAPSAEEREAMIPYRTLERGDFLSPTPPPQLAGVAGDLCAATCAQIVLDEVPVTIRGLAPGGTGFEARPDRIRFRALMDPHCSWWRAGPCAQPAEYVLQHEQVHFALVELEARRLNARSGELAERVRARGRSPEEASARSRERLEAVLRDSSDQILEGHTRFDEDASLGYRPERQQAWYDRTMRELAEAAAGGR